MPSLVLSGDTWLVFVACETNHGPTSIVVKTSTYSGLLTPGHTARHFYNHFYFAPVCVWIHHEKTFRGAGKDRGQSWGVARVAAGLNGSTYDGTNRYCPVGWADPGSPNVTLQYLSWGCGHKQPSSPF